MAFTPASSIISGTVTVSGTVAVSNFPASQAVTGPLTAAELAALEPLAVTGPLTAAQLVAAEPLAVTGPITSAQLAALEPLAVNVGNFPATQPVSGPLTNAELRAAAVEVDASGATVPVSVDSLPLPDGAATEDTALRSADALDDVGLTAILERGKIAT